MDAELQAKLLGSVAIPGAVLIAGTALFFMIFNQVSSLYVRGNPNEWVLILNNGVKKQGKVGINAFRGPYDQVVKFPSKVNRVIFTTEQVTKEMQGVKVEAMLVWSIYREGDGPLNAYKNLGEDLSSGNPATANNMLIQMASSIVRDAIANSTIRQMLTSREQLRESIRNQIGKVVKGMGVWIETVEITDVTISSTSLFKDLQANFRENMKRDAEVYRMEVEQDLNTLKTKKELELNKVLDDYEQEKDSYREKINLEIKAKVEEDTATIALLQAQKDKLAGDLEQKKKEIEAQAYLDNGIFDKEKDLDEIKYDQLRVSWGQKMWNANFAFVKMHNAHSLDLQKMDKDYEFEIDRLDTELQKKNIDASIMKYYALEATKQAFNGRKFEITTVNNTPNDIVNELATSCFTQEKALKK